MEESTPTSTPQPIYSVEVSGRNIYKILFFILLIILVIGGVGFFAYNAGRSPNQSAIKPTEAVREATSNESQKAIPTETISPSISSAKINDNEALKEQVKNAVAGTIDAEMVAINPVDSNLAVVAGPSKEWKSYGIYLYNIQTKAMTDVLVVKESIYGRGGIYLDNRDAQFSPTGEYFFVNKTGMNFPSFVVVGKDKAIVYQSTKDLGHGAWINGKTLLFITDTTKPPSVLDAANQAASATNLPVGLFHLKTNQKGTKVIAFSLPKKALECESYDIKVFQYPSGTVEKTIENTGLKVEWTNFTTLNYEKVTGCTKVEGESMVPFTPNTVEKQETITE